MGFGRTRALVVVAATLLTALAGPANAGAAQTQPNVIVVMTDDQRLWDMEAMPKTNELIGEQGTTFTNSFSTYPLCCPSRSTFLSGQYAHNHGVLNNAAPDGGFSKFDFSNALGVWLQQAGYRTAHVGKQLNEYGALTDTEQAGDDPVPPGYDEWFALRDPTTYSMYDYVVQDNDLRRPFGVLPEDYQTDVLANRAIQDIRAWAPDDKPFFMHFAPSAVHWEFIDSENGPRPAPRHIGAFADHPLHPRPNFLEEDISDKPSVIQHYAAVDDDLITDNSTRAHRTRLEALQSVDEFVERMVAELKAAGELDNTLIVFTSDNGYLHGEHGFPSEKVVHYEESTRVPLLIRGPGFPAGETRSQLVGNIDLAPTIADLAGATPGRVMDGESLVDFAGSPDFRRDRSIVLEADFHDVQGTHFVVVPDYHRYVNVYYDAIRTDRFKYVHWFRDVNGDPVDEYELYDLAADPYELESLHESPRHAELRKELAAELETFKDCAGADCRRSSTELKPPCLRSPMRALDGSLGPVSLGIAKTELLTKAGSPNRAGERTWRYCVGSRDARRAKGRGKARVVFSRAGAVRLIATSASTGGAGGDLLALKRGGKRFVVLADDGLRDNPRALRRYLRLAGLKNGTF